VPPLVACIGPVTADTAHERGLRVDVVADVHTMPGLVDALAAHFAAEAAEP
jgi:uroporphyrinogen-III synthase